MIDFFYPNQEISLPSLADHLNIESDKFTVIQKFDGGMGSCYQIKDTQGASYALKIIHSDLLSDEPSITRYYEELKLWLTFSSCEGIAEAICIIRINDIPCIVSTWMDKGDMGRLIKIMEPSVFYYSMDRIISTLKWVNDNYHVIHRDLKPGNILIDSHYQAYIADWGLAKLIQNPDYSQKQNDIKEIIGIKPALTQKGAFVGTVLYASPEQLLGSPNIDHRSDIYSLGCIMYEWETGKPPFIARTIQEIASGHLYTKPEKLGGLFKSTNFKAEKIIMKCLEKKPEDRYQTYDELLCDLHQLASKILENFCPYKIKERYIPINIGHDEFVCKLKNGGIGIVGKKGYGLISREDVMPYIREAFNLSNLGNHQKAIDIYKKLFAKDIVVSHPDFGYHQLIAINLANSLNNIGECKEALSVISSISKASIKPSEYYVNLSNIYINLADFLNCVLTCEEGLAKYKSDLDIISNHTIGLTQLGRLQEAIVSAENRLKYGRDIHSVCEAANVMYEYAEQLKNIKFPEAIDLYKTSLKLYREALQINPHHQTALYNVVLILFKMKRYADSMSYGADISKIEKGTTEINAFYAARNLLWTGSWEKAKNFCDNWLKSYPNSILLKRVRAEVLVDGYVIGHYTKEGFPLVEKSSLDFFMKIVQDPVNRIASDVIFLAKIHCWMNEAEEIDYGLKLLEWGKVQYPDNWKFNFYLAAFALKYKQPKKALQEALECQRKAPWRETAYNMLANAYSANSNDVLAAKMHSECERIKKQKAMLYSSCKND